MTRRILACCRTRDPARLVIGLVLLAAGLLMVLDGGPLRTFIIPLVAGPIIVALSFVLHPRGTGGRHR